MPNGTNVNFFGTPFGDNTDLLFTPDGLAGNDVLEGDSGDDTLNGLDGIDQIKGEEGFDILSGGAGDDSLFGGAQDDVISGEADNDYAEGGFGNDSMLGGAGDDVLWGDNADGFVADPTNNVLPGPIIDNNHIVNIGINPLGNITPLDVRNPENPDFSLSLFFNPVLEGDDTIRGGDGNDLINGEIGDDQLFGDDGDDTIKGSAGFDLLSGGIGDDVLDGGDDSDTLIGGLGSDTLTGGDGFDVFKFSPDDSLINTDVVDEDGNLVFDIDVITDFDVNQDRIDLTDFDLGGIDGNSQFAFDDFSNGMTQGLESAFFQQGADVIIGSRPDLGYDLGSLGTAPLNQSQIIIQNVNIDDLGGSNFIFTPEILDNIDVVA